MREQWLGRIGPMLAVGLCLERTKTDMVITDFIKPGEFTFCSRCGDICRLGDENFMCISCTASLFSKKENTNQIAERRLSSGFERQVSDINKLHREQLAKLRRRQADGEQLISGLLEAIRGKAFTKRAWEILLGKNENA